MANCLPAVALAKAGATLAKKDWGKRWYDVRTEIDENYDLLQGAFALLQQPI